MGQLDAFRWVRSHASGWVNSLQVGGSVHAHSGSKPFTEPVNGVLKGHRTTLRFRRALTAACTKMRSLKAVREEFSCSTSLIYKSVYSQLEIKLREYQNPWPKMVGVDEHFFCRRKGYSEFFTIFTDLKGHRVREAVYGRSKTDVLSKVTHIQGREP